MYQIENLLRATMGLDAASVGSSLIERTVRLRMKQRRLKGVEDYHQFLETSPAELNELIESLVVTETWFFRDREAFAVVARQAVNEWLPAHPIGVLRILSVPCSSGEEPCSLAMALLDAGLPPDRFQIDGVDISALALSRAQRGIYGKNSFRAPDPDFRKQYFQPVKEGFLLSPAVRSRVFLQRGNLLDDKCLAGTGLYDFIFCRNLLIYFDRPTQAKALQKLERLLIPTGLCFVGPAELPLIANNGFVSANIPMAFACRKQVAGKTLSSRGTSHVSHSPSPVTRHPSPKSDKGRMTPNGTGDAKRDGARVPSDAKQRVLSQVTRHPSPLTPHPPPSGELETARRLADTGRLSEARVLCETHLREYGPSAQAYFQLGLVRAAAGEAAHAATCYRKALYLDPQHRHAMLQLALLAERDGDVIAARRFRQRLHRIALPKGAAA